MFYPTLLSDSNHSNAHLLKGTATEFIDRGGEAAFFQPRDSSSFHNLLVRTKSCAAIAMA
jgi:hypothetical protein